MYSWIFLQGSTRSFGSSASIAVLSQVTAAMPFVVKKVLDDPEMPKYAKKAVGCFCKLGRGVLW